MFSAAVRPGTPLSFAPPKLLFVAYFQGGGPGNTQYDVAPDGRFLMMKAVEREAPAFGIILNWGEALQRALNP